MTEREEMLSLISDLHKDAYGFRPSQGTWVRYKAMTTKELSAEWDSLLKTSQESMEEEKRVKQLNAKKFEERIADLISMGAQDRATAIRWIADAEEVDGDMGFLEYKCGLEYNYLKA